MPAARTSPRSAHTSSMPPLLTHFKSVTHAALTLLARLVPRSSSKSMDPNQQFPFALLPTEIRVMIYHELFGETTVHIDTPRRLTVDLPPGHGRSEDSKGARLPSILFASKWLRNETLPIFAPQVHLHFHRYLPSLVTTATPAGCFPYIRSLTIDVKEKYYDDLKLTLMPELRKLLLIVDVLGQPDHSMNRARNPCWTALATVAATLRIRTTSELLSLFRDPEIQQGLSLPETRFEMLLEVRNVLFGCARRHEHLRVSCVAYHF